MVFTAELLAAGLQAGVAAAILVPLAHKLRGYSAVGGEWLPSWVSVPRLSSRKRRTERSGDLYW